MKRMERGFTLIELLVALAVLAITLTVGMPAFATLLQGARETNAYHLLTSSLAAARIAAIKRNEVISVCPSKTGVNCRMDSVWDDGWIIFIDAERSGQPASIGHVLQHIDGIGAGLVLHSTDGRPRVRFTPDGWSYGSNLTIRLCNTDDQRLLGKVVVNNAGRPRTQRFKSAIPCPYLP